MKLRIIFSFNIFLLSMISWTQQMPQYTQFTQNKSLFNPAAMALNQHQAITMASRWQMLGFGLEPRTVTLYGQMKYKKKIKVIFNPASRIGEEIVVTSKKQKIKLNHYKFYLFYGDNEGLKEDNIKNLFEKKYKQKLKYSYSNDIWNFISLVWESPAILSVTTIQDVLNLGRSARFNIPGTKNDNWSWRLESMQELDITIDKLKELNENNSRVN